MLIGVVVVAYGSPKRNLSSFETTVLSPTPALALAQVCGLAN